MQTNISVSTIFVYSLRVSLISTPRDKQNEKEESNSGERERGVVNFSPLSTFYPLRGSGKLHTIPIPHPKYVRRDVPYRIHVSYNRTIVRDERYRLVVVPRFSSSSLPPSLSLLSFHLLELCTRVSPSKDSEFRRELKYHETRVRMENEGETHGWKEWSDCSAAAFFLLMADREEEERGLNNERERWEEKRRE